MTFDSLRAFLSSVGGKIGSSSKKENLYSWVKFNNIIFFERQYSKSALSDSLFSENKIPEYTDEYSSLIEKDGDKVNIIDYLVDRDVNPQERAFILRFLLSEKPVYAVESETSFILKLDNNLRGVVYIGKGNVSPS